MIKGSLMEFLQSNIAPFHIFSLRFILPIIFLNSISEAKSLDSIICYVFLLDDCVISQSYTPKINDLYKKYKDRVTFVGVFPNFSSKRKKINAFKEKYKIRFDTRTDYFKTLTDRYKVKVTPEVVVYNKTKNNVIYKGRIDNEFFSLGKRRRVVNKHELRDVLESILQGQHRSFDFTEAIGCLINMYKPG